jgi:hypothetical protein
MRRIVLLSLLLAGLVLVFGNTIYADVRNAFGFETISVTSTAQTLSSTYVVASGYGNVPDISAYMTLETGACRWRADGTAPTGTVGHLLNAGDTISIIGYENLKHFKAILSGATTGTLSITYEKK